MASRFTLRFGQALRDIERAIELNTRSELAEKFTKELKFKRTLIIDPKYTIAKNNLAALPEFRRTGPPVMVALNEPFKTSKLKQSITFIKE